MTAGRAAEPERGVCVGTTVSGNGPHTQLRKATVGRSAAHWTCTVCFRPSTAPGGRCLQVSEEKTKAQRDAGIAQVTQLAKGPAASDPGDRSLQAENGPPVGSLPAASLTLTEEPHVQSPLSRRLLCCPWPSFALSSAHSPTRPGPAPAACHPLWLPRPLSTKVIQFSPSAPVPLPSVPPSSLSSPQVLPNHQLLLGILQIQPPSPALCSCVCPRRGLPGGLGSGCWGKPRALLWQGTSGPLPHEAGRWEGRHTLHPWAQSVLNEER